MNCRDSCYDDCCLLTNITFNAKRISYLLERRFQRNSTRTGFDFKALLPEKPSTHTKVSRSFLRIHPTSNARSTDDDLLPESAPSSPLPSDHDMDEASPLIIANDNDELDQLGAWEPGQLQAPTVVDSEDDEESMGYHFSAMDTEGGHAYPIIELSEPAPTEVEDLHVTFVHVTMKNEPITVEDHPFHLPQLDGQTDLLFTEDDPKPYQHADNPSSLVQQNPWKQRRSTTSSPIFSSKSKNPIRSDSSMNGRISESSKPKSKAPLILSLSQAHRSSSKSKESHRKRNSQPALPKKISNFQWEHLPTPEEDSENDRQRQRQRQRSRSNLSNSSTVSLKIPRVIIPEMNRMGSRSAKARTPLLQSLNIKREVSSTSKRKAPLGHTGKTILDYFEVIKRSKKEDTDTSLSHTDRHRSSSLPQKRKERSKDYFRDCVVIDDDEDHLTTPMREDVNPNTPIAEEDIQEIQQPRCSLPSDIRHREKLLTNTVHSSVMRMKWLSNLELLLLEHISNSDKAKVPPIDRFHSEMNQSLIKREPEEIASTYSIQASLISLIVENFLKLFIVHESFTEQEELAFYQFGFTSHLRYLFLELSSFKHDQDEHCRSCNEYASILNRLLDVLFDVIDLDLCERNSSDKYRSSLFEDDYFYRSAPVKSKKTKHFFRLKLILYLIEMIGVQRNRCSMPMPFSYHRNDDILFHWIEDAIQHLLRRGSSDSLNDERIPICFNVMELCLLLVDKKITRVKRMAVFLAKMLKDHPMHLHTFLFDQNLFADIRVLLINEFIWKRWHVKLSSIDGINQFFCHVQTLLTPSCAIDESTLLLLRSLFTTYADLVTDNQHITLMCSTLSAQITLTLRHYLDSVHSTLLDLSENSSASPLLIRTVVFFRLLQCKWKQF